jgi:hypothetical protein
MRGRTLIWVPYVLQASGTNYEVRWSYIRPAAADRLIRIAASTEMGHSLRVRWTRPGSGSHGPWEYRLDSPTHQLGPSPPRCANWLKVQPEMCASSGSDRPMGRSGHMPGDGFGRLATRIGAAGRYLREQNTGDQCRRLPIVKRRSP